jgi:hypothetical protein
VRAGGLPGMREFRLLAKLSSFLGRMRGAGGAISGAGRTRRVPHERPRASRPPLRPRQARVGQVLQASWRAGMANRPSTNTYRRPRTFNRTKIQGYDLHYTAPVARRTGSRREPGPARESGRWGACSLDDRPLAVSWSPGFRHHPVASGTRRSSAPSVWPGRCRLIIAEPGRTSSPG